MFYGNKFLGIMQLEFNYFVEYEKSKWQLHEIYM
jgi:hypothetical protein